MSESGQKQGSAIIERYDSVVRMQPEWEDGYFEYGKYCDFLLMKTSSRTETGADEHKSRLTQEQNRFLQVFEYHDCGRSIIVIRSSPWGIMARA